MNPLTANLTNYPHNARGSAQLALKVVAISGLAPHQAWLLDKVAKRCRLLCVVRPVLNPWARNARRIRLAPRGQGRWERLKESLADFLSKARVSHLSKVERLNNRRLQTALSTPVKLNSLIVEIEKSDINRTSTAQLLRSFDADILLVAGAPKLSAELCRVARFGAINIHFGCMPAYRGEHNIFAAMLSGNPEQVAVTAHHLSDVLDGGNVLFRCRPELKGGENEAEVIAACTRLSARLLDELLTAIYKRKKLEQGKGIELQNSRLIRYRDRSLYWDASWQFRRLLRLNRPVSQLIEKFF